MLGWFVLILLLFFILGMIKPSLFKMNSRKSVIKLVLLLFLVILGLATLTEGIGDLFLYLCFLSIIFLFIGLIKPTKVKMASRKRVLTILGSAFLLFFILGVTTLSKVSTQETAALEKMDVKDENIKKDLESKKDKEEALKKKQEEKAKALAKEEKAKELAEQKKKEEAVKAKQLENQKRLEDEKKAKELAEQKRKEEELAKQKAAEEAAKAKAAEEAAAKVRAEEAARAKAAEEAAAKARAEEAAKAKAAQEAAAKAAAEQASTTTESFANCTELRKVYPNGVSASHPAYDDRLDRDKDGTACERY